MWRHLKIGLLATITGSVLGGLVLMWVYPALRAAAFPERMGLVTLAPGIAVEAAFTPPEQQKLLSNIHEARAQVARFYGSFQANVKLLACKTDACDRRLSGRTEGQRGAAAMAYGAPSLSVLALGPRGLTPTIIAHELSHAEVNHRLGVRAIIGPKIPAWVNEGLSVIVSDDPRYLGAGTGPARCLAPPIDLPETVAEFRHGGATDDMIYARAACGLLHWMARNGGRRGLIEALDAYASGTAQGDRFRPVSTR